MKCDKCDKPAVVHEVVIRHGVKQDTHLCAEHAAESGYVVHQVDAPINQLLTQFVISHGGKEKASQKACPECRMTLLHFRRSGTLGCPDCYETFDAQLGPLIERAHAGATHHVGKIPRRAGSTMDQQMELRRLARELDQAVAAEQYERAAEIRDRLLSLEPECEGRGDDGNGEGDGPA